MRRLIAVCAALVLGGAGGMAHAKLPPPTQAQIDSAAAAKAADAKKAQAGARTEAEALARAHERAIASYKRTQARRAAAAAAEKRRAAQGKPVARARPAEKSAPPSAARAAEEAKRQAAALARAQDRVVTHYRRSKGLEVAEAAPRALEKLYCTMGTEDRQARIAVEVRAGKVQSVAYYSKWKPRTCSVHIMRDDSYSSWEDTGSTTVVTLIENKGAFLINNERNRVHFILRDIDRGRFCGMDGKINGSLTVTRGRSTCAAQGIMDGHEG